MRIQILILTPILNPIISQVVVGSQSWLLQREPRKTRLRILCRQKRIEAFGVWGMSSMESCI